MRTPWVPPGRTMVVPDRGELFYRHHEGGLPGAPTLLLLHGWTASADVQFFTAYEALAAGYPFLALDHRGHGRGLRIPFTLEDVADDAAALVRGLGLGPVITVGYSMGGPVSMLLARRHPDLVAGLVVQATALEWSESRLDRFRWKGLGILGTGMRSRFAPRFMGFLGRLARRRVPTMEPWVPWLAAELRRTDPGFVVEAGHALRHYDARPWAGTLGLPAAMLITTEDRLVFPAKQRALADALGAEGRELVADHLCTITHAAEYSSLTRELVDHVAARVRASAASDPAASASA